MGLCNSRMLAVSHIFGHGFDRCALSRLESLGFCIRPNVLCFAGAQLCRFIDFAEGPSLEVIEVEDHDAYLDFVPKGMIPYCPGVALVVPPESVATSEEYSRAFSDLDPYLHHVTYEASEDEGPGWNYLHFEKQIVADTFVWLTFFDDPRPVSSSSGAKCHANAVQGVSGFVFDLEPLALNRLSQLVGTNVDGGVLRIGRTSVWPSSSIEDLRSLGDKRFPLIAVVLKASSLDFFSASLDGVTEASFMSRPAVQIVTNPSSWDLLITT